MLRERESHNDAYGQVSVLFPPLNLFDSLFGHKTEELWVSLSIMFDEVPVLGKVLCSTHLFTLADEKSTHDFGIFMLLTERITSTTFGPDLW